MHDITIEAPKQYQCRHIFTDGRRCASPCLRQEEFCYYHHTTRKPVADPRQRRSRRSTFRLPLPEDRSAIQSSIGEVLQRIASNDIDPRRAGLLLYGLQIASLNLGKIQPTTNTSAEHQTVEEITIDSTLGVLAPRAEISKATTRKSSVVELMERMLQREQQPTPPDTTILPTIQAAVATVASDEVSVRHRTFAKRCNTTRDGLRRAPSFTHDQFAHGKGSVKRIGHGTEPMPKCLHGAARRKSPDLARGPIVQWTRQASLFGQVPQDHKQNCTRNKT